VEKAAYPMEANFQLPNVFLSTQVSSDAQALLGLTKEMDKEEVERGTRGYRDTWMSWTLK